MLLCRVEELGAWWVVSRPLEVLARLKNLANRESEQLSMQQYCLQVSVDYWLALICNRVAGQYFEQVLRFDPNWRVDDGLLKLTK